MDVPTDFVLSLPWQTALDDRTTLDPRPTTYLIIANRRFGRLLGESPILYIGATGEFGGSSDRCRLRTYSYPSNDHDREIRARLETLTQDGFAPAFHWKYGVTEEDAKREEGKLLRAHFDEHRELPPLNHKRDWVA